MAHFHSCSQCLPLNISDYESAWVNYASKDLHHDNHIYICSALFAGKSQHGVAMELLAALKRWEKWDDSRRPSRLRAWTTCTVAQYGEMKKQSAGRRVRREKIRRKKMQVREKVGKSRNIVFFRGFVAPEGRKVGSLKRRVRRHLGRWEMKSCTPLWREADFEVKRYKTPQRRTTFGSWDVEKVHGVVARSTFGSKMC